MSENAENNSLEVNENEPAEHEQEELVLEIGAGKETPVNLADVMSTSYIDYAMSVIVARALPDVRDGLKPVHRRILYAMSEAGMTPTKPYKKSARIVGEVLGKYHPHGDSSVYDAIVRMAQDFSIRYPLADGHGNFGSVDGDPAAAMRYTEVRMSKISELMLQDIERETVDFVPNYDESLKEPSVLPSKFPQLLVNGSAGIAVGMATNIPPHNLREAINGVLMLIDHPEATIDDLMTVIPAPDFPTGGEIIGTEGVASAYTTGRGVIVVRATSEIEMSASGKAKIIVTELPYQVNKARLIEKIAELVRDKTIDGITALRDESDRKGMRIVIEVRKDTNANVLLNQLYKHTPMQDSFGVIMLALVNGRPKVLTLKEILQHYLRHQETVLTRRTRFDLAKAEARQVVLLGLTVALDNLDEVISIIRTSQTADLAKATLMDKFALTDKQVQAILELRLQRLTGLERAKVDNDLLETGASIERYQELLADESKILALVKSELTRVRDQYGDARRTRISADTLNMNAEDLIAREDIVVTVTHGGYVKRIPLATYRTQKRGGRGVTGMGTKETDFVEHIVITSTHDTALFFTSRGVVYPLRGFEIPESSRQGKGTAIVNLLNLQPGEKITAVIAVGGYCPDKFLFMATKRGVVKKTQLAAFSSMRRTGLIALLLRDDDELIGVKITDGQQRIILGTRKGMAVVFEETDVRATGRTSHGVRGIRLKSADDAVIGMDTLTEGDSVLTVSEQGFGKRTDVGEYRITRRGGVGVYNLKVTEKTGAVVGLKVAKPGQELMLITAEGIVIRTTVDGVSQIGRNTQGVMVMRPESGDTVASLAVLDAKDDVE